MTALRNKSEPVTFGPVRRDCIVDYSAEVTKEQVRKVDESVRKELERGNWITVEEES